MKRWGFAFRLTCAVLLGGCAAQAQLDQILNKLEITSPSSSLPGMSLSNDKIAGGLKEALTKSTGTAVASTGRVDGYFKNQAIKILLPGPLQTFGKGMRMMGMGAQLDDLELAMNRAAEQAAPAAKQIFLNAITKMSFDDARKMLSGGNTAATDYFKASQGVDTISGIKFLVILRCWVRGFVPHHPPRPELFLA
jgi:hypothetical protein